MNPITKLLLKVRVHWEIREINKSTSCAMYNLKMFTCNLLLCITTSFAFAQTSRTEYCACKEADEIQEITKVFPDSLYTNYSLDATGFVITLINTTKDTLYVFNSYIEPSFLGSKYLHRINAKDKLYKVSFLPLVPYVFTKYSDVITDEPIIGNHQIVYNFFKLPPSTNQKIKLSYNDLFKSKNSVKNVSKDYDVKTLHKYSKRLSLKFCTTSNLKGKYNLQFEFAVYKAIDLLCEQSAYYLREQVFDKQSKDFKILIVPVELGNYEYPLLSK